MFQLKSFVFVALIGMIPGIGVVQQAGPPIPANESNLRVVSGGSTAPLRPTGQPEQVPQPLGTPSATKGITLAELGQIETANIPPLPRPPCGYALSKASKSTSDNQLISVKPAKWANFSG